MAVIDINQDVFKKEVLDEVLPVFVDFHAEWCGPCKMTSPLVAELSETENYKGKMKFVAIDVDANNELAGSYSVFSIPTFIIFKAGKPVSHFVGARDRAGFTNEIDKALSS